jgi:hypothetical protein
MPRCDVCENDYDSTMSIDAWDVLLRTGSVRPSSAFEKDGPLMPGKRPLRGVNPKEQRQYEHIKESAQREGRYGQRAAEVAARTVLKQHARKGHRKGQ